MFTEHINELGVPHVAHGPVVGLFGLNVFGILHYRMCQPVHIDLFFQLFPKDNIYDRGAQLKSHGGPKFYF